MYVNISSNEDEHGCAEDLLDAGNNVTVVFQSTNARPLTVGRIYPKNGVVVKSLYRPSMDEAFIQTSLSPSEEILSDLS